MVEIMKYSFKLGVWFGKIFLISLRILPFSDSLPQFLHVLMRGPNIEYNQV